MGGKASEFEAEDSDGEMAWICDGSLRDRDGTAARAGRSIGDFEYIGESGRRILLAGEVKTLVMVMLSEPELTESNR